MSRRTVALIGLACLVLVGVGLAVAAIVSSGSDSGAGRWSAPARVPLPASAAASARASFDPSGRAHVAWVERRAGRWSLHTIDRAPGGDWSAPRTVVRDQPFSISVAEIAGDSRGDEAVLWVYSGERRSVVSASVRAAEEEWGPEQALSRVGRGRTGRLAMDERGAVTVVGRGLAGPGLWAVRRDPAEGWSAPERVSPRGHGTDSPALSIAADGSATIVALLKSPGEPRRLFSVSADAGGAWGPPRIVPGSALATGPGVSVTAAGDTFVSWGREMPGLARHELRLARRPREGAWSAPVVLDGPGAQPGPAAPSGDGDERAVVAWPRWEGRPEDRRASIRAIRAGSVGGVGDPAQVASLTLPDLEAPPGVAVIYGPVPVQLIASVTGPPALVWSQVIPGTTPRPARIMTSSLLPDGSWEEPVAISEGGGSAFPLAVGSSSAGSAAIWIEGPPSAPGTRVLIAER